MDNLLKVFRNKRFRYGLSIVLGLLGFFGGYYAGAYIGNALDGRVLETPFLLKGSLRAAGIAAFVSSASAMASMGLQDIGTNWKKRVIFHTALVSVATVIRAVLVEFNIFYMIIAAICIFPISVALYKEERHQEESRQRYLEYLEMKANGGKPKPVQVKEKPARSVLMYLPDGYSPLEAAAFIEVFGWNLAIGEGKTGIVTTAKEYEAVGSHGLHMIVDQKLENVDTKDYAALIIPGFFPYKQDPMPKKDMPVTRLLHKFHQFRKPIVTTSTGSMYLTVTNICTDRRVTSYITEDGVYVREITRKNGRIYPDQIIHNFNLYSSRNPATATEVALLLLEELTDKENADKIRKAIGLDKFYGKEEAVYEMVDFSNYVDNIDFEAAEKELLEAENNAE
ncbi:MAG: DJ-1/PfpI family protein [Firmicutes bacterium]|nr:DJ-1/PfpI family protein [Bacillota bacterium]